MIEVTKSKAIQIFNEGRTVFVLPSGVDIGSTVIPLHVVKSPVCRIFPEDRIENFKRTYASLFGNSVRFFVEPFAAKAIWNGRCFILESVSDKKVFRVPGREASLVRYANSHGIDIKNRGMLMPNFRNQLHVK
ncbi:MAG TPA: hypothetical protein VGQ59_11910 [Cyclobacteriaceae bacterium]|nr:hypothetical protein [Cyclobacteriaceae bacterium]